MHTSVTHYTLGSPPVTGAGHAVSAEDLDAALAGPAAAILFDDPGTSRILGLLEGLKDTDFAEGNLALLLSDGEDPEDWRVGEALAEYYLNENRDCFFPWPDGRDERKRGSSLPGADLVGFQRDHTGTERFAFGEVKTSADGAYPPGVTYGRHGFKQQMEDLRNRRDIRDGLVRYLGHRAVKATWLDRFRSAAALYLKNTCDVRIVGLLIRDVQPHEDDLRVRVDRLSRNCPAALIMELIALYLPLGSIGTLSARVVASRNEGSTA